eukprot:Gregarina_sp_Poly_1__5540@NODE_2926_length_1544_cov_22_988490_g1832_i1_p2_GENE_NODE_2926_length_1544_cov_22_988490_g1832_i1NODE_2926_length_1544_cov_22_988490_g1832_i1_p2_ORF_typecomplete_len205_score12_30MTP18/PF10558_9/0_066_NODE_2926_length_1544_cov_22_988490_g1832_i1121735
MFIALEDLRTRLTSSDFETWISIAFRANFATVLYTSHYLQAVEYLIWDVSYMANRNNRRSGMTLKHDIMANIILEHPDLFSFQNTYKSQLDILNNFSQLPLTSPIKLELLEITTMGASLFEAISLNLSKALGDVSRIVQRIQSIKSLIFDEKMRIICFTISSLSIVVVLGVLIYGVYLHRGNRLKRSNDFIKHGCLYVVFLQFS